MTKVDVIVVGSGQAGVPLATRLAAAGREVVVAERSDPGGTCVNYGCTPTKTMIASARAAHVARTAGRLGVHAGEVRVDFAAVVARKNEMVRRWREGVERRLAGDRIRLIRAHARFVGARELEIGGERWRADTVIVNVGARPAPPRIEGTDAVPWLDSHRALDLSELPRHLAVVGGGYIGCELGQMFRRFGSEVTVIGHAPHLLEREDPDVSQALEEVFRAEGIRLELGTRVERVARAPSGVSLALAGGAEIDASHLLVATGRVPNTQDLGCDAAGIALDEHGFVVAGERYETSAPGVYAVGDAIAQPQFTHTSWDDHRLLFETLMGRKARPRSERLIPSVVFTDPHVAAVGLKEKEVKARGLAVEKATMPFAKIARAREIDEQAGLCKILLDPKTERILGVALVGAEAAELLHIFVALMQAGASARALVDAECAHPTFAEGMQSLVMTLDRYTLR
jgi:pyruvate/2-oxoglutarate dehydrogenase complex dihydrolipoamide dehydrogenase (E3) component